LNNPRHTAGMNPRTIKILKYSYSILINEIWENRNSKLSLDESLTNAIIYCEEGIMKAEKTVNQISSEYKRYWRKMSKVLSRIDRELERDAAEKKAVKERQKILTEGIEIGSKVIAQNALAEGASCEFVQKITGLDMNTILELKNLQKQ